MGEHQRGSARLRSVLAACMGQKARAVDVILANRRTDPRTCAQMPGVEQVYRNPFPGGHAPTTSNGFGFCFCWHYRSQAMKKKRPIRPTQLRSLSCPASGGCGLCRPAALLQGPKCGRASFGKAVGCLPDIPPVLSSENPHCRALVVPQPKRRPQQWIRRQTRDGSKHSIQTQCRIHALPHLDPTWNTENIQIYHKIQKSQTAVIQASTCDELAFDCRIANHPPACLCLYMPEGRVRREKRAGARVPAGTSTPRPRPL